MYPMQIVVIAILLVVAGGFYVLRRRLKSPTLSRSDIPTRVRTAMSLMFVIPGIFFVIFMGSAEIAVDRGNRAAQIGFTVFSAVLLTTCIASRWRIYKLLRDGK